MNFELHFLGAAGTVTGSRYLLSFQGKKILVDCGLLRGVKALRLKNWDRFPVEASEIHALILTHAHIDHSGYIPRLIKEGFKGKIYSTAATRDLCQILLTDSGHLMEEEANYLNRKKRTIHAVIHLQSPSLAMGYNRQNPIRTESADIAGTIDRKIHEIWKRHLNYFWIESAESFLDKVNRAAMRIQSYLPECCKGHLEEFQK